MKLLPRDEIVELLMEPILHRPALSVRRRGADVRSTASGAQPLMGIVHRLLGKAADDRGKRPA